MSPKQVIFGASLNFTIYPKVGVWGGGGLKYLNYKPPFSGTYLIFKGSL